MEFNREQIINDLDCFRDRILHSKLAEQVYGREMMSIIDAIALIKELTEQLEKERVWADSMIDNLRDDIRELTEENKRLKESECDHCACELLDQRDKAKAEVERLQDLIKEVQQYNEAWVEDNGKLRKEIKTLKADTVRKMREKIRAKSEYGTINISPWQLEQIAKEILEENK